MYDMEQMDELVRNSRKQLFYARIRTLASVIIAAAIVLCLAVVLPKALDAISQADEVMAKASETIVLADEAIAGIMAMSESITEMGDNMDDLITDNAETIAAVMEKIEAVDFEGLNGAIKNLGDVVAPLAKFFNLF